MAATISIKINTDSDGGLDKAKRDVADLGETAKKSGGGFNSLKEIATGALREIGSLAVNALGQAAQAVGSFVKDSIGAAGDFEAGMNTFQSAAGEMGQAEVAEFKDLFLSLGKELPVSTKEVQDAATAMVKGGIDPATVAAGGLKSTLLFAAAAGMELENAADLTAKQLGTFVDVTASAAEKTEFMAKSQELLVKAANASTLNVDALGDAMLAAGGQVKAIGMDYQDFVTTMGLISPSFASAAEAGTSFKNFLSRLVPSTNAAKDAMMELGLMAEDGSTVFFDAQGNFLGAANAAEQLKKATEGLSDAERVHYLQTIFGNDAMGSANALISAGASGYDAFAAAMANANGIQATAANTQQGLNFAMENFGGSVEALQITLGTAFLPLLTQFITQITGGLNTVMTFVETFLKLAPAIGESANPLQTFVNVLAVAASSAIPGAGAAILGFWANLQPTIGAVQEFITYIQTLIPIFQQWATAALTVGQQLLTALMPAITAVGSFVTTTLMPALMQLGAWLLTQLPAATQTSAGLWNTVLLPAITAVSNFIAGTVIPALTTLVQWLQVNIPPATQAVVSVWNNEFLPVLSGIWSFISGTLIPIFNDLVSFFTAQLTPTVQAGKESWDQLSAILHPVGDFLAGGLKTALENLPGPFKTLTQFVADAKTGFSSFKGIVDTVVSAIKSLSDAISKIPKVPNMGSLTGIGIPGRAIGGPVAAGAPYIVGEDGPELFVPGQNGRIVPNVTNNYNYSPTYSATPNRPSQDFMMMRSLVGAGV